ncbi:MAG: AI-2E family transporter [Lachnoclostridium sp.]|jgi:predicted PurR-regulated permease PerM|nr:AI-2E family transporter [Lachnoclostridium sp.]
MWNKIEKKYLHIAALVLVMVFITLIIIFLFLNWQNLMSVVSMINSALRPLYIGLIIAYLLNPLLRMLELKAFLPAAKKIFKKKSVQKTCARGFSIFIALSLSIFVIAGILMLVLPELVNSIDLLIQDLPNNYNSFRAWLNEFSQNNPEVLSNVREITDQMYGQLMDWLRTELLPTSSDLIIDLSNGIINAFGVLFNLFIGLIFSIYLMANKELFCAQTKKLLFSIFKKERIEKFLNLMSETHTVFGKFISGKLLDSLIVGIFTFFVLTIANIPYAILISFIIGVTNIIPFFGQYIGTIPSAILVFLVNPMQGVIFLILIIIILQIDGNIIGPRIMGESIGLGSFWVLFSILIFGSVFGLTGMVFAVPIFAMIFRLVKNWSASRLIKKELPVDTRHYMSSMGDSEDKGNHNKLT